MSIAKKQILVVDDEEHNRAMYSEAFEDEGNCEVVVAKDGLEAYRIARQRTFDAICTDFRMPKLDGAKLISALRDNETNKKAPLFVITGFKEEATAECEKAKVMEGLTFVEKPVSPNELVQKVKPFLTFVKGGAAAKSAPALVSTPSQNQVPVIDQRLLNPFVEAVVLTLKTMGQVKEIKPGQPFIVSTENSLGIDISGIISIVSTAFRGTLYVSFPKPTFLKVVGNMLGEIFTEITPNIQDAGAEFTNIIYGNTKRVLSEQGYEFQTALPFVVLGKDLSISGSGAVVAVPFATEVGNLYMLISLN